jgi:nucleotide-binding universal stress UspA family protein
VANAAGISVAQAAKAGLFGRVLAAVEHGTAADVPLREADRLAGPAVLNVLHVLPDGYPGVPMTPGAAADTEMARERLARQVGDELGARLLALSGRDAGRAHVEVEGGSPHSVILQRTRALGADLVVVGAHREDPASPEAGAARAVAHAGLGSVATHVVHDAPCAVLVARPPRAASHKLLVATDFSPAAEAAVAAAIELARAREAGLVLLHSAELLIPAVPLADPGMAPAVMLPSVSNEEVRRAAYQRLERIRARAHDVRADILVVEEPPADAIAATAAAIGAALVVLGRNRDHAGSGLAHFLLGSVADAVVKRVPCSVLVVRPPADRATATPTATGRNN